MQRDIDPKKQYTLLQAAQMIGVCPRTVYAYAYTGRLPAEKRGTRWRISGEKILAFLNPADAERQEDEAPAAEAVTERKARAILARSGLQLRAKHGTRNGKRQDAAGLFFIRDAETGEPVFGEPDGATFCEINSYMQESGILDRYKGEKRQARAAKKNPEK